MTRKARERPPDWLELVDLFGVAETAEALGIPKKTLYNWVEEDGAAKPSPSPRFEGWGHGAPAWKTEPGRAVPESLHVGYLEPEVRQMIDAGVGAIVDPQDPKQIAFRDELRPETAGPVRVYRGRQLVEVRPPYTTQELRAIRSRGERQPHHTQAELRVITASRQDLRERERLMEEWYWPPWSGVADRGACGVAEPRGRVAWRPD